MPQGTPIRSSDISDADFSPINPASGPAAPASGPNPAGSSSQRPRDNSSRFDD